MCRASTGCAMKSSACSRARNSVYAWSAAAGSQGTAQNAEDTLNQGVGSRNWSEHSICDRPSRRLQCRHHAGGVFLRRA